MSIGRNKHFAYREPKRQRDKTTKLTSRSIPTKSIKFESTDTGDIFITLPTETKNNPIKITKLNAIKLSHWILDNCSVSGQRKNYKQEW